MVRDKGARYRACAPWAPRRPGQAAFNVLPAYRIKKERDRRQAVAPVKRMWVESSASSNTTPRIDAPHARGFGIQPEDRQYGVAQTRALGPKYNSFARRQHCRPPAVSTFRPARCWSSGAVENYGSGSRNDSHPDHGSGAEAMVFNEMTARIALGDNRYCGGTVTWSSRRAPCRDRMAANKGCNCA